MPYNWSINSNSILFNDGDDNSQCVYKNAARKIKRLLLYLYFLFECRRLEAWFAFENIFCTGIAGTRIRSHLRALLTLRLEDPVQAGGGVALELIDAPVFHCQENWLCTCSQTFETSFLNCIVRNSFLYYLQVSKCFICCGHYWLKFFYLSSGRPLSIIHSYGINMYCTYTVNTLFDII